jgi:hypothetical protein
MEPVQPLVRYSRENTNDVDLACQTIEERYLCNGYPSCSKPHYLPFEAVVHASRRKDNITPEHDEDYGPIAS